MAMNTSTNHPRNKLADAGMLYNDMKATKHLEEILKLHDAEECEDLAVHEDNNERSASIHSHGSVESRNSHGSIDLQKSDLESNGSVKSNRSVKSRDCVGLAPTQWEHRQDMKEQMPIVDSENVPGIMPITPNDTSVIDNVLDHKDESEMEVLSAPIDPAGDNIPAAVSDSHDPSFPVLKRKDEDSDNIQHPIPNVTPTMRQTLDEENRQKRIYLGKFNTIQDTLRKRNISLSIDLTSARAIRKLSLEDLRFEYDRVKRLVTMQNSIQTQRNILMTVVSLMEMLNNRYDPFSFKLKGWSDTVNEKINQNGYDDIFQELFEKYHREGRRWPPEIRLMLGLGGSALMCHLSHTIMGTAAVPNVRPAATNYNMPPEPEVKVPPPTKENIQDILDVFEMPSLSELNQEENQSDSASTVSNDNMRHIDISALEA